tara:strand:+ start:4398 stop:4766 length:369 start_codon:yes stop_codon:yes gene_type:complete
VSKAIHWQWLATCACQGFWRADAVGKSKRTNMKSAYELAMEKLQKESPDSELSAEQKAEIAELDNLYQSKLAEREVFLGGKIEEAKLAGDLEAHQQLERELISDRKTLEAELEEKKEAVRNR